MSTLIRSQDYSSFFFFNPNQFKFLISLACLNFKTMVSHDNGPYYPVLIRCKRNRLIRPKLCIKLPTDLAKFGTNNSAHNPVETKLEQPQTLFITLSVSLSSPLSLTNQEDK